MRTQIRAQKMAWLTLSLMMMVSYQNCSEFHVDAIKAASMASVGATQSGGQDLEPKTDKFDPSCLSNPTYDACVIKQNPVAQLGVALATAKDTRQSQLAGAALYGVKLTSLSGSGSLENSTISVLSMKTPRVPTIVGALKERPLTAGSSNFEQANVYYWLNRTAEYFDGRTSVLPAKGKGVKVVVDDTITGYDPANNTIRLKMTDAAGAVAWNADLVVHLFGVANLHLANPTGWNSMSATTHRSCSSLDKGCCAQAIGCAGAIKFGVGEYFAAVMNPQRSKIGDGFTANGTAQVFPGAQRDLTSMSTATAPTLFANSAGDVHSMGLLYTSLWFEARRAASTVQGLSLSDFDRMFLEHLTLLNGSDTFATALDKARSVDQRLFAGRYSSYLTAEQTRRGL